MRFFLRRRVPAAVQLGHVFYFRRSFEEHRKDGWEGWDASVAKNSAALAAQAVSKLRQEDPSKVVVVNVDNDQVWGEPFVQMLVEHGREMTMGETQTAAFFYRHPRVPSTTGRIACTLRAFLMIGGYWEGLLGTGSEDVFLMKCLSAVGQTVRIENKDVGTAVQNGRRVKQGKKGWWDADAAEKVANVATQQQGMSYTDMNNENWRRCKDFMKRGLKFPINGKGNDYGILLYEDFPLEHAD